VSCLFRLELGFFHWDWEVVRVSVSGAFMIYVDWCLPLSSSQRLEIVEYPELKFGGGFGGSNGATAVKLKQEKRNVS
jgi:hypothetical protein